MNALLITLAALAVADLQYFENFAENPSFEVDGNRDDAPDGWRAMAFDSPAQLEWDSTAARSGNRSLRISETVGQGDQRDWKTCTGRWVSSARPIVPGESYTLSVWIKTEGVTGQAYAHLAWQRGTNWLSEEATQRISDTSEWQKVTVTTTAPEEADALIISMNLTRSRGTAWFDDIQVSGKSEMPAKVDYVFNDTTDWFPFTFPTDDTNLDSIDLTGLLDAPAGKHGFVSARDDGHFYFEDGLRARFFGTNVGGGDCAPPKQQAPAIAARLAKYGVNMLRLHSMDSRWGPLIDYGDGTSQRLNAEALDRMDFFVAELKRRGIYVYMDLLDYRQFTTADGVTEGDDFTHNWQGSMKGASIFDPRMIELQKDYATRLLTHRNPYTGLRYVDEPAVAVVETTNENSIFYFYRMTGLSRQCYRDALTQRWNKWLLNRHENRAGIAAAWTDAHGRCALLPEEDPQAGTVAIPFGIHGRIPTDSANRPFDPMMAAPRISDLLQFFGEIQRAYYTTMRGRLKAIGVRVPIAGTNQSFTVIDTQIEAEENDFISRNQYWRHPHRNAKPFFKFANEPLCHVDIPTQRNPLSVIARTSVVGKPQGVAEFNFPWPNEYRAEGLLMSAAYACLQDWDIFLLFSYSLKGDRLAMFSSQSDPARWGAFPAAALLFHRGDVSPARNEVHVVHTPEDAVMPRPDTSHARYTNQRFLTFLSKVRTGFAQETYNQPADVVFASGNSDAVDVSPSQKVIRLREQPWEHWLYPDFVRHAKELRLPGYERMQAEGKRLDADTGELSLDYGRGLLTINTDRTQAAIGLLQDASPQNLADLTIDCRSNFAAITASSLDGNSLGDAKRILVTAVGRAENTAQGFTPPTEQQLKWTPVAWMLPGEGRAPVIAEPIRAELRLRVPGPAKVFALDATGRRTRELQSVLQDGRIVLQLEQARSIWCEVVVP